MGRPDFSPQVVLPLREWRVVVVANGGTTHRPDAMGRASIPELTCCIVTHTHTHRH